MNSNSESKYKIMKMCIDRIEALPTRVGTSVYVRIEKGGEYQMLDIESKELYEFMFRELFQKKVIIDRRMWKSAVDYILGDYTLERMKKTQNRIGIDKNTIYYDILDINSKTPHFVEISKNGWNIRTGNLSNYEWNSFQLPQELPVKGAESVNRLLEYVNIEDNDKLMFLIYLISCFIPNIQHPILNICGEAGTGKSTLSRIIKDLVDPSSAPLNDFSDGEDGIRLPLSQNYLTVFDNVEQLPKKLNALFCRAVTGGETIKRKLYTDNEQVAIPLKSIVVINGISSAIRREDLMSRTIFLQTKEIKSYGKAGDIWNSYLQHKREILAGVFDILAKAMSKVDTIKLKESYRMMEFTVWGYAIAEALGSGKGEMFLSKMKANEVVQLQETYANEPLLVLLTKYMSLRKGEEVCMLTSAFYEKIMREADVYLGSGSNQSKKMLPHTPQTFTKKVNSLKGVFRKMGIIIDIDRTGDVRNLSQISICMADTERVEDGQGDMKEEIKGQIIRIPIVGIRKPITKAMLGF